MHRAPQNLNRTGSFAGGVGGGSCFAARLSRYADLTEHEHTFVSRMEENERRVRHEEVLVEIGQTPENLFILKEGWAVARSRNLNGRTQVVRIYLPGEMIGLPGLGTRNAAHEIAMITDGVVCPFPRDHMTAVYAKAPRLAALLTAISSLDQIALKDRLAMMGVGSARERMAHFLLDVHERLLQTNPELGRRFRLPLRQVDIGEVLGLTKVYVNRLLRGFTDEELIEIQRPYVRMLQPERLRDIAQYTNRYEQLDNSWFPSVRDNELNV
ncbi:Crp/Fnr family transcriptional regulator [Pseudooceanicola atlanticus]|uniref:Crp/Fnr family transcriptional regulator n=1 Tax=Pseudooceanicola atlanticus TaxID=1461694 RepID=UPI0006933F54|nr:Crp/Fnr family transcriptional regulator [Pseudooceanicola atlanticus]